MIVKKTEQLSGELEDASKIPPFYLPFWWNAISAWLPFFTPPFLSPSLNADKFRHFKLKEFF